MSLWGYCWSQSSLLSISNFLWIQIHRQAINSSFPSCLPLTISEYQESKHVGSALCCLSQCHRLMALKAACCHSLPRFSHQTSSSASLSLNQVWWFHPHLLPATALKWQKVKVFIESSEGYTLLFSVTLVWSEKLAPGLSQKRVTVVLPPFLLTLFLPALTESQLLRMVLTFPHPSFLLPRHPSNCMEQHGWSEFTRGGNHSHLDFDRGGGRETKGQFSGK